MGETMLVTQALDERDLLVKKITDKIEKSKLRGMDSYDGDADFEGKLQEKLNNEYNDGTFL